MDNEKVHFLEQKAIELRTTILTMIHEAGSGHPGGSLSAADYVTALYFNEMKIDPKNPKMHDRDRFILSKGHACPVWYSVLALKGYFDFEIIHTLRKMGSILQGHPDMKKVPGIDMSTGSLGQGLSIANGMACSAKMSGQDYRTYVVMGDGELQEGQVWEAAMTAAHYKFDNLCAFIDNNNLQIDGHVDKVMGVEPLDKKWESFGWNVIKVDGHSFESIICGLNAAKACKGKPSVIIAITVKGKGVSFMENVCEFHGVAPDNAQTEKALEELSKDN